MKYLIEIRGKLYSAQPNKVVASDTIEAASPHAAADVLYKRLIAEGTIRDGHFWDDNYFDWIEVDYDETRLLTKSGRSVVFHRSCGTANPAVYEQAGGNGPWHFEPIDYVASNPLWRRRGYPSFAYSLGHATAEIALAAAEEWEIVKEKERYASDRWIEALR